MKISLAYLIPLQRCIKFNCDKCSFLISVSC